MEILSGLRSASVHRLKKTWAALSSNKLRVFEELLDLMSSSANYARFRTVLHKHTEPPCCPFLGLYLTDLTFTEDGNPESVAGLINFDRCRRIAAVIKEIKQYQQIPYNFQPVPIIKGFLLAGGEYIDENQCYKLSLEIEPRSGEIRKESISRNSRKSHSINDRKRQILMKEVSEATAAEKIGKAAPTLENRQCAYPTASSSSLPSTSGENLASIEDLADCLLEGNSNSVEQYFQDLNCSEEEKQQLRAQVIAAFESKAERKGVQRIDILHEAEMESMEIPFNELVEFLIEGNMEKYEDFFRPLEIYAAERIREQTQKLLQTELQRRGISLPVHLQKQMSNVTNSTQASDDSKKLPQPTRQSRSPPPPPPSPSSSSSQQQQQHPSQQQPEQQQQLQKPMPRRPLPSLPTITTTQSIPEKKTQSQISPS